MSRLSDVVQGMRRDRLYIHRTAGGRGEPPLHIVRGLLLNPGIRAAALMRLAAGGGVLGKIARNVLISLHGCDVSPGAQILGGLRLPHPIGIVIGSGVVITGDATIYQGVTLGANRRGDYPVIGPGVTLFPSARATGKVLVGANAVIGAAVGVYRDVPQGAVVRDGQAVDR